jgi:UDP-N-acetylmuramoylalanine--D-glutamate ligase
MADKELIFPGQTVCILGLGVTGRAAVRYCLARGAKVRISDARSEERLLREEGDFIQENELEWEAGGHSFDFIVQSKVLLPSPGVDLRGPLYTSLLQVGVVIAGELAVVAPELQVPVVAVTGTNGKTTVTTLIGEVLAAKGIKVFVGGNIGTPLYEYCLAAESYDAVVVEVSSFQLETSGDFAPDIAILLNITPDHLDRHATMAGYLVAKERIFSKQREGQLAVINGDDPFCKQVVVPKNVEVQRFGRSDACFLQIRDRTFSLSSDDGSREDFLYEFEGSGGFASFNFAAAFLALRRLGLTQAQIDNGFRLFRALPHRLEFVAKYRGVSFINDSKATNTGAVVGALGNMNPGVVLIAGGRGKGDDYNLLRKSIEEKVHTVVLIGETAEKIKDSLDDIVVCLHAKTMEEAVSKAFAAASAGETVLLSPACASFDMFNSYGHRGNVFKAAVQEIAGERQLAGGC